MKNRTLNKKKVLRLFDANLNRCREGLRVVEDTVRFFFENEILYKKVRKIRHKVDRLSRGIYSGLLKERDSIKDSGRKIKEGKREDLRSVLISNFKRAEESLRVLEEYSRLVLPAKGGDFKKIRFSVYALEKEILLKIK